MEGAEPGDTLTVKILDLQVDGDMGVGAFSPGFGAINGSHCTPVLEPPLKQRVWFYHIDHAANTATFKALDSDFSVKIPVHSFFGCIGVAPADGEARKFAGPCRIWRQHGLARGQRRQHRLFPRQRKRKPPLSRRRPCGHGKRRDCGLGSRSAVKGAGATGVIKDRKISWPQFENDDAIMTVGAYRPLEDAVRIGYTELVAWIHRDYGPSDLDAYELLSKVGRIHMNEMVDPNYVVVTLVEKKYLPPKKKP